MSGGQSCKCAKKHLRVFQRYCNHSAFSGYQRTPSAYSSIRCLRCGAIWRTNAKYVPDLADITEAEMRQNPYGGPDA